MPALSDESIATIEAYWSADLGCSRDELREDQLVVTRQDGPSIFVFARHGAIVSVPAAVGDGVIVGPAFIGYADAKTFADPGETGARLLDDADAAAVAQLRGACDPTQWEHGGASAASTCVGVFAGATLAALASFELWGARIAHISIVTHPAFRSRGLGRAAVAGATRVALERNLVAQYRTLLANVPSMAIARDLGFQRYALTLAIRLPRSQPFFQ
jgi:GNAT superfamily N-acetyltransferase